MGILEKSSEKIRVERHIDDMHMRNIRSMRKTQSLMINI